MATDHSKQSSSTDHSTRRLRPKRNLHTLTSHEMPTKHVNRVSKRPKVIEPPASHGMMDSSDEECDEVGNENRDTENESVPMEKTASREETVARKPPNPCKLQDTDSTVSYDASDTQHFATLLALADIDRKRSAHLTSIRRQRHFANSQTSALSCAQKVDEDTKLLHSVLKALSTMSGVSISKEDMVSTTSVGLFTCRAMRAYALAYDKDPIKPVLNVETGWTQEQQSKLKMVQSMLNTMLA
jgi:hypothetical protein